MIQARLQDVDVAEFETLQANDIPFIDSAHVSKINSDAIKTFFDILPRLSSGVHVQFHDIFFPFEYPKDWAYKGMHGMKCIKYKNNIQVISTLRGCHACGHSSLPGDRADNPGVA